VFSNSTKYGIRAIVHMMKNKSSERNTVVEMAAELKIPQPFLSKVLQQLAKSDIISSTKGRGGGFYMTKKNMQRPLVDVIICIEGHNVFNKCILGLDVCSDDNPCILHPEYK
jgi:Rrf2 family protein